MLLLFDIDGTLLQRASTEHAQALHAALHSVHRIDADAPALRHEAAGRTDGEIARLLLLDAGVSAERIDALAGEVRSETCRLFAQLCPPDLSDRVVPGMPELLAALSAEGRHSLALVTGNFEAVARLKLRHAGIGQYFPSGQGGFGSDSEDRTMLPAIARRRAGGVPREQTVVIGDTPRDIACARADRVRCIAVTTGPYGAEQLRDADAVAGSVPELGELLAALD